MTDIDYAARVAKGVALLDERWPNWATEIDVDTLDVGSAEYCVTAQYAGLKLGKYPDFSTGQAALHLESGAEGSYVLHGFNAHALTIQGQAAAYDTLNALWKGVIAERRAAADTPTEGAS